jgi:hypothetical protein
MAIDLIDIVILLLGLFSISILNIEKWDLIKRTWGKFKTLFTIYILWSKEDRIRAAEIRKKYKLPSGTWIKDENKIKAVKTNRKRRR